MLDQNVSEIVNQAFARHDTVDKRDLVEFFRGGGVEDIWVQRLESLPEGRLSRQDVLDGLGEAEQDRGVEPFRKIA